MKKKSSAFCVGDAGSAALFISPDIFIIIDGQLGAVTQLQAGEQGREIVADGSLAEIELGSDLFVVHPFGDERQDGQFPFAQFDRKGLPVREQLWDLADDLRVEDVLSLCDRFQGGGL